MANKDSQSKQEAAAVCEQVIEALASIGSVGSRRMFGGHGIFESGAMFALVNSAGEVYLKVGEANRTRFDEAGSKQHARMPYFQVPQQVLQDAPSLREWAAISIEIAHAGKKK